MTGRGRTGCALPPAAMLYWDPFGFSPTGLYIALMIAVWCAAAVAVLRLAVRLARTPPAAPARAAPSAAA